MNSKHAMNHCKPSFPKYKQNLIYIYIENYYLKIANKSTLHAYPPNFKGIKLDEGLAP